MTLRCSAGTVDDDYANPIITNTLHTPNKIRQAFKAQSEPRGRLSNDFAIIDAQESYHTDKNICVSYSQRFAG